MYKRLLLTNRLTKCITTDVISKPGFIRFNNGALSFKFIPNRSYCYKNKNTDAVASSIFSNLNEQKGTDDERMQLYFKPQKGLLDEVKRLFESTNFNSSQSPTIISNVIKDLNRIFEKPEWTACATNAFLSSPEFRLLQKGILHYHQEMDQADLNVIIKFLESLGLTKDSHLPLKKVYGTLEKRAKENFSFDTEHNAFKSTKDTKAITFESDGYDISRKLQKDVESTYTNNEMIEFLKEAKNLKIKDMSPTFLINYYKAIDKVDDGNLSLKDVKLKSDAVISALQKSGNEFIEQLPQFLLIYTKTVRDRKEEYSEAIVKLIIENLKKNERLAADQHFVALRALNNLTAFLDAYDMNYLQYVMMNHVIDNPRVLESIENLDIFLESLKISDFSLKYQNQLDFIILLIKDLSILKEEQNWKNVDPDQLRRIVKNLMSLQICPEFLSSLALNSKTPEQKLKKEIINENEFKNFSLENYRFEFTTDSLQFTNDLPQFLLNYAKEVVDYKSVMSVEMEKQIIEKFFKDEKCIEMGIDQHFVAFQAVAMLLKFKESNNVNEDVWIALDLNYFRDYDYLGNYSMHVLCKLSINSEFLESVDNLNAFLEIVKDWKNSRLNDKYQCRIEIAKSIVERLTILKEEEKWKNTDPKLLQRIVDNLTLLQISPIPLKSYVHNLKTSPRTLKSILLSEDQNLDDQLEIREFSTKDRLSNVLGNIECFSVTDSAIEVDEAIETLQEMSISATKQNITPVFLISYYKLLDKVPVNHPKLGSLKLMYKLDVNTISRAFGKGFVQHIPTFLSFYSKAVADDKEKFNKKLMNISILALMTDEKITIEGHFSVLKALNEMKTFNGIYVQHVVKLVLEDSKILEDTANLNTFLEALANCDFPAEFNSKWPYLKNVIQNLPIFDNENTWKDAELSDVINITKNSALFGIYSKPLLSIASQRVNEKPTDNPELWSTILLLNQAIDTLHPSFNQRFLSDEALATIDKAYNQNDTLQQELNTFIADVKSTLELETYENDVFIMNCFTKLGPKIDLILALNELDQPFSFSTFLDLSKKCFVEDISLPDNYELVLISLCLFRGKNCLRDSMRLDSEAQLKIKTLQAMGYTTVSVFEKEWVNCKAEDRGSHFWKKIVADSKCQLSEEVLEKVKEPVSID